MGHRCVQPEASKDNSPPRPKLPRTILCVESSDRLLDPRPTTPPARRWHGQVHLRVCGRRGECWCAGLPWVSTTLRAAVRPFSGARSPRKLLERSHGLQRLRHNLAARPSGHRPCCRHPGRPGGAATRQDEAQRSTSDNVGAHYLRPWNAALASPTQLTINRSRARVHAT